MELNELSIKELKEKKKKIFDEHKDFIEGLFFAVNYLGEPKQLQTARATHYKLKKAGEFYALTIYEDRYSSKSDCIYYSKTLFVSPRDCILTPYIKDISEYLGDMKCCAYWSDLEPLESSDNNFIYPGAWQKEFERFITYAKERNKDFQESKVKKEKDKLLEYFGKLEA